MKDSASTTPRIGRGRSRWWPLYKRRLQRSRLPILVGPWRGELGFEALYWVPFVRKLGIPRDRLIVVTRGGAHLWYPADQHVELYDLRQPRDLRIESYLTHARTGMMKQQRWTPFDEAVIKDAAAKLGLTKYLTLHPHWMYGRLAPFFEQDTGLARLLSEINIESLPDVTLEGATLPPVYTAARFYARATFPMSEATHTVAIATLKQLAAVHPVILLNSGFHADDHVDFGLPAIPNVVKMTDLFPVTPQNNLSLQSALISKAQGFVGTYGGLAQLALMYKKPTISLYQDWQGTAIAHKHLMDAIALQMGVCAQVVRITEIPQLHAVLPKIQIHLPSSNAARELSGAPVGAGA